MRESGLRRATAWVIALLTLCGPALAGSGAPGVSTGQSHTLAVGTDGRVFAWGSNSVGQLGQGKRLFYETPTPIAGVPPLQAVSSRFQTVVALDRDGYVWSWGLSDLGERSHSSPARPGRVLGLAGVAVIDNGFSATLAVRANGEVWAWGFLPGQVYSSRPVRIQPMEGLTSLAMGSGDIIGVHPDGSVYQLGGRDVGQFAAGVSASTTTRVKVAGLPAMRRVYSFQAVASDARWAGIAQDGSVWVWGCWGDLDCLNNGVKSGAARKATGLPSAARSLALTYFTVHAALEAGTVYGTTVPDGGAAPAMVRVATFANASALAAFDSNVYALRSDGFVDAIGANSAGQIGNGTISGYAFPEQRVINLANAVSVAAGQFFAYAVRSDGVLLGWGSDYAATISGEPRFGHSAPLTVTLPGGALAARVAAGPRSSFAITATGALYGWGENFYGNFGLDNATDQTSPVLLPITGVADVAAGLVETVVVRNDGTVWVDGYPGYTQVAGISGATRAYVGKMLGNYVPGREPSFVLTSSGTLYGFGYDTRGSGIFAETRAADQLRAPAPINGIGGPVVDFSIGADHALALLANGTVMAWGRGTEGQLGDGSATSRTTPALVPGLSGVVQVSAGGCHSLALRADGTVWSWGCNFFGTLGDGSFVQRNQPQQVANLDSIAQVAAGFGTSFAVRAGGLVFAWGNSANDDFGGGTLGDGALIRRVRPVLVSRENGLGNVDRDDWFLDLAPGVADNRPGSTSKNAATNTTATNDLRSVNTTVLPRFADIGKNVGVYVLGLVPPAFLDLVKTAPGTPTAAQQRAKAGETLVLVQRLPDGEWAVVSGSLTAYTSGTLNALGAAVRISSGIPLPPGSRFCVGYGESADAMLTSQSLAEVLVLEGAAGSASGVPCVITGVYVSGPSSSTSGTAVTFNAAVVGLSPTGTVQFKDGLANLLSPVALTAASEAVRRASITTASLAAGVHSIGASYSGDTRNVPQSSEYPLRHEVRAAAPGATSLDLTGPVSSELSTEVVFAARVVGNNPTGTVQFRDGASDLSTPQPLVGGVALLRLTNLALGAHSISAAYSGDGANAAGTSGNLAHTVYGALVTSVALASSSNPSNFGTPVTFSASVAGNSPTGTVTFRNEAATLATVALSGGNASLAIASLPSGVNTITATYSGDSNNQAVTSSALFQQVRAQAVGTAPNPFRFVARNNVAPGSVVTSNAITVGGIGVAVPVTVSGGAYSIGCTGSFVTNEGMVSNGQTVCARHTASASLATSTSTTLTIGGVSATFTSTTYSQGFVAGVAQLVTHYYQSVLRRAPDAPGQAFWEAEAARVAGLGASPNEALYALAMTFFFSPEYTILNRTHAGFVTDLYSTFFNRAPDSAGFDFWLQQVAGGMPREGVLVNFMFSPEFANFTTGIFGAPVARGEVNVVMDFYRGLLSRLPDGAGFDFYVGQFRQAQCSGAGAVFTQVENISSGYLNSPEYSNRGRTNAQFMADVYNAFMRRGPDLAGMNFYVNQLNTGGKTREQIRQEFKTSPEFNNRVNAIIAEPCAN